MHPLLDVRPWPRALLQYPLLILSAALLGAALAFAYSYAPLHRAKDWQISYLEERLQSRTEQVESLEEKLRTAETSLETQPSSEEVKALRAQLDEANGLAKSLEKEIGDLEWNLTKMTRSRDSWKQKHSVAAKAAARPSPPASSAAPRIAPAPDADDEALAEAAVEAGASGSAPTPGPPAAPASPDLSASGADTP